MQYENKKATSGRLSHENNRNNTMIELKTTSCRLIDKNNGGVTLYRVVTKVTDGKTVATFRRFRLMVSWSEMSDRDRRAYFREEVNEELFAVLNKYDTIRENIDSIKDDMKDSVERSKTNLNAYKKCIQSPHGFWELYDFK